MSEVELYEALDEMHIEITCSSEGEEWFWRNTDTGEEGQNAYANSTDALYAAAAEFGIYVEPQEPDYSDDDGMTDVEADAQTLAMAGWGTDEDYGRFHDDGDEFHHDHLERDHDEPYIPDGE